MASAKFNFKSPLLDIEGKAVKETVNNVEKDVILADQLSGITSVIPTTTNVTFSGATTDGWLTLEGY